MKLKYSCQGRLCNRLKTNVRAAVEALLDFLDDFGKEVDSRLLKCPTFQWYAAVSVLLLIIGRTFHQIVQGSHVIISGRGQKRSAAFVDHLFPVEVVNLKIDHGIEFIR